MVSKEKNKGITLVVLVITIIVLLIITAVSIGAIEGGIISYARSGSFSQTIAELKEELILYISNEQASNLGLYDSRTLNAVTYDELKICMNSIKKSNYLKFNIVEGQLAYVGDVDWEIEVAKKMGILVISNLMTSEVEDYETETLVYKYTGDWYKTNQDVIAGEYSYRSKEIGNNEKTSTEIKVNVNSSIISYQCIFDYKISTEYRHDYFTVKNNGKEIIHVSGSDTATCVINLEPGENKIKFEYAKDESSTSGIDTVMIDNLRIEYVMLKAPEITYEVNGEKISVNIEYPEDADQKVYACIENVYSDSEKVPQIGEWKNYEGNFEVSSGALVYAKYIKKDGRESSIISKYMLITYDIYVEDYETEKLKYTYEGNWERTDVNPLSGNYSFRSASIGNYGSTSITTKIEIPDNGFEYNFYFQYYVSSEGCDPLKIVVNGETVVSTGGEASGSKDIQLHTGTNTMTCTYSKDGSINKGYDLAMIDNLRVYIRKYTAPIIEIENTYDYKVKVKITYPDLINKKCYSLDEGENWLDYIGEFIVDSGTTIYAKYINEVGEESDVSSKQAIRYMGSSAEDFETEDFIFSFEGDWIRTKDTQIDGRYSYRSKPIGNYGSSSTSFTIEVPDDGTEYAIYFDYFVSSESNCDPLNVTINGNTVLSVSGDNSGGKEANLSTGTNVIRFTYSKDGSINKGYDLAMIDNVRYYQREITSPVISYENGDNFTLNASIFYPAWAIDKLYSLDEGETWNKYNGTMYSLEDGTTVYAKYINGMDIESSIVSKQLVYTYIGNLENFEDDELQYNFEGDWYRTKDIKIDGRYSLRSKPIENSQSTSTTITIDVPDDRTVYNLCFDYYVSSESNCDPFIVTVNESEKLHVSGGISSYAQIPLFGGTNIIKFKYSKDGSLSRGNDMVMIDNIEVKLSNLAIPLIRESNLDNGNLSVEIIYPVNALKKYYSLNNTEWYEYTKILEVASGTTVYAKYIIGTNLTSTIASKQVIHYHGTNTEGFENDETIFNFEGDWYKTQDISITDIYSLRSAPISDSQRTETVLKVNIPNDGYNYVLYFDYYVSSESCDPFTVIVNDSTDMSTAGETRASHESYLKSGENTLIFRYSKDGSWARGNDLVLIDNVQIRRK